MSYYESPYSDDAYERHMHTGELAEYFEAEIVEDVVEEEVEVIPEEDYFIFGKKSTGKPQWKILQYRKRTKLFTSNQ